jgi:hypothetical protein
MPTYNLINPYIKGSMVTEFKKNNSLDAAKSAWEAMSVNFSNVTPLFAFTLLEGGSNKKYHFSVKEKVKKEKVSYSISELKFNESNVTKTQFKNKLDKFKNQVQQGGRRKRYLDSEFDNSDEDDDDDDDDDDFYRIQSSVRLDQPISWFWYYPTYYPTDYCYIPTWSTYSTPYVYLAF